MAEEIKRKFNRRDLIKAVGATGVLVASGGLVRTSLKANDNKGNPHDKIGDLAKLHTSDKTNLVNALNENWEKLNQSIEHSNKVTYRAVNVMELGAMGDGVTDDTAAVQAALDLARKFDGVAIYIPDGDYRITTYLRIYRNTKLKLGRSARMIRSGYVSLLINSEPDDSNPLLDENDIYSGHGNITIEGGIWDGNILNQPYVNTGFNLFTLMRARNIVIRDVEFRDVVTCHALDFNALENVLVDNCRFLGYKDATEPQDEWYPRDYCEAIQIDHFTEPDISLNDFYGSPCRNVTVRNCYFGESGTEGTQAWPVGVGNHSSVHDIYNENIKIVENTFQGMTLAGVRNFKYKNCFIIGNQFIGCYNDILCSNVDGLGRISSQKWDSKAQALVQTHQPQSAINMIIKSNIFEETKNMSIYARGYIENGVVAKVEGILIKGNIARRNKGTYSTSNSIHIIRANNVKIKDYICNGVRRGVYMEFVSNVDIENMTIDDTIYEGVYITEADDGQRGLGYTNQINISNNLITNIPDNGILLNSCNKFTVKDNRLLNISTLQDDTRSGINTATGSAEGEIEGNIVRMAINGNANKYGVYVTDSCSEVRVGTNDVEGKTAPIRVDGNSNWVGQYVYTKQGKRFRYTITDNGKSIYIED